MYQMRGQSSQSCGGTSQGGKRAVRARRPDSRILREMVAKGPLKPLGRAFYARPVVEVARACVGCLLVCRENGVVVGRIVESEAYRGPDDRAAHSYAGRRTARTEVMFGRAGHAYVFSLYGQHRHLNLVTGSVGQPEAVLIRAVEPIWGLEIMSERRNVSADEKVLTNGPGKLCQAFGIDKGHNGRDLTCGGLFLCAGTAGPIARSPRVGVDYAGPWALRPWRFFERGNRYVSGPARSSR